MTSHPEYVEFTPDRTESIVATMSAVSADATGWINFEPAVEVDDVAAAGSGTFALFSGRGPVVPLATWTPASTGRRGRKEPAMLGLQHPAGSKARPLLARLGHPVPEGWTVVQDHVRKGLVLHLPPDLPPADALRWLLRAATVLTTVPLLGGWRASVYRT